VWILVPFLDLELLVSFLATAAAFAVEIKQIKVKYTKKAVRIH
jgi:hypothetical protein